MRLLKTSTDIQNLNKIKYSEQRKNQYSNHTHVQVRISVKRFKLLNKNKMQLKAKEKVSTL